MYKGEKNYRRGDLICSNCRNKLYHVAIFWLQDSKCSRCSIGTYQPDTKYTNNRGRYKHGECSRP